MNKLGWKVTGVGVLFMLPGIIMILFTIVIPLVWNLVLSFMEWNGGSRMTFVKLNNYFRVFTERQGYGTILNSLFIGIVSTIVAMVLGIFLALSVYRLTSKESTFCRFVYFSTSMMPMTVVGLLFAFVLAPDGGLVNSLLEFLHLDFLKQGWLSNPKIVNWSLAFVQGWKASGTIMMLFYTALIRIPPSFFEAGKLEGAGYFHELKLIIMPLMKPALALTLSMMLLWSFKSYDIVWTMTRGGPGDVSETAPLRMITIGFSFGQFGYAAAIGVVLTILVSVCIGMGRWITRGEAYEY
ncbi:MAG: sugar ABC transporter permease [Treponema sp.]|jgi:raffinose/stachyose/melibiose transport system permease protein|nr:sugar ABC transporter permease [Treponema sp.]